MITAAAPNAPLRTGGNVPSTSSTTAGLNHGGHLDPDLDLLTQPRTLLDPRHLVDLAKLLVLGRPALVQSLCGGGRKTPVATAVAPRGADVAPIPDLADPNRLLLARLHERAARLPENDRSYVGEMGEDTADMG